VRPRKHEAVQHFVEQHGKVEYGESHQRREDHPEGRITEPDYPQEAYGEEKALARKDREMPPRPLSMQTTEAFPLDGFPEFLFQRACVRGIVARFQANP